MLLAETPRHGLMWNRSGLPAVFPLILKTVPGRDHVVVLRDPDTGRAVLSAYAVGGRFFKVLVPPGTFRLDFAAGTRWRDAETLFGPETERFTLDTPLTFEVRGIGTKAGHIVDLRGVAPGLLARRDVGDTFICQTVRLLLPEPGEYDDEFDRFRLRFEVREVLCG